MDDIDKKIRRDALKLVALGIALGFLLGLAVGLTVGYNYGDRVVVVSLPSKGVEV